MDGGKDSLVLRRDAALASLHLMVNMSVLATELADMRRQLSHESVDVV